MTTGKLENPQNPILVVDDEIDAVKSFELTLQWGGFNNTIPCSDPLKVYDIVKTTEIELVLLDLFMPHLGGDEILRWITESFTDIPVIMVTGINEIDTAVRCMRDGAFDYVLKPVNRERLLQSVSRAIEIRQLRHENAKLKQCFFSDSLEQPEAFSKIITQSPKMRTLFRYCEAVAKGNHPILITGETGVGKELIAEAIHRASGRRGSFVCVNAAGLDDNTFSDTLFGHVRGAFTDAVTVRKGQIELAAGGTMFLDEIGDLSTISQIKMLRLLDKNEYLPLGSDVAKPTTARFLFATNRDLSSLIKMAQFREDLFYRLRTHHLHIPPLRERIDDVRLLLDCFIGEASREFNRKPPPYANELLGLLRSYQFPGNVRELRSMVFDAVGQCQVDVLHTDSFRASMKHGQMMPSQPLLSSIGHWLTQLERLPTLRETTTCLIEEALVRANKNQRVAALLLGITPQALNQRLKRKS